MSYGVNLLFMLAIYTLLGLSLNLLVGYSGFLSTSHAAFYGIGAYVVGLLVIHGVTSPLAALIVATISGSAIGAIVARFSISLKRESFVIATLAIQILFVSLFRNLTITGGPYGLIGINQPALLHGVLKPPLTFLIWSALPILLAIGTISVVCLTPFARVLKAGRDDEELIRAAGKSLSSFRTKGMAISSAIAALAGGLFALYSSYIAPTAFTLDLSILCLMIVIIGGSGNLRGPFLGAGVMVALPEALRFLPISSTSTPYLRQILFGAIIIVLMRLRPQGLIGSYELNRG